MKIKFVVGRLSVIAFMSVFVWLLRQPIRLLEKVNPVGHPVSNITYTVEEEPLTLQHMGKLESTKEIKIMPGILSEVVAVHVKEGDWVERGDTLMSLDTTILEEQIAKAKVDIEKVQNFHKDRVLDKEKTQDTIDKLDKQLENIEKHLERLYSTQSSMYAGPTYKKDIASLEEQVNFLEILKQTLEILNVSVDDETNQLTFLQENYQKLLDLKEQYQILSPIKGRISAVNIQVGDTPSMHMPALVVASAEHLKLNIKIPKEQKAYYSIGHLFPVEILDLTDQQFILQGKVSDVLEEAYTDTGLYTVTLVIENPDEEPLIGALGKVCIPLEKETIVKSTL